jgi:hypothetical protein
VKHLAVAPLVELLWCPKFSPIPRYTVQGNRHILRNHLCESLQKYWFLRLANFRVGCVAREFCHYALTILLTLRLDLKVRERERSGLCYNAFVCATALILFSPLYGRRPAGINLSVLVLSNEWPLLQRALCEIMSWVGVNRNVNTIVPSTSDASFAFNLAAAPTSSLNWLYHRSLLLIMGKLQSFWVWISRFSRQANIFCLF